MKKKSLKKIQPRFRFTKSALLISCFLAPLLTQCIATEQNVKTLDLRIRTLDNRLITIDRDIADLKDQTGSRAKKNSVEMLQKKQADVNSEVERFKTQMLQVKGQLDESAHHYQTLQDDNDNLRETLTNSHNELRGRIKDLNTSLTEQTTALSALIARVEILEKSLNQTRTGLASLREQRAMAAAEQARQAAKEAAEAAANAQIQTEKAEAIETKKQISPSKAKKSVSNDQQETVSSAKKTRPATAASPKNITRKAEPGMEIYDQALENFRNRNYKKAYIGFSDYIEKHPKGEMVANARFWLGDSLYNQNEYELAILEYQKVIADFGHHPKAAAALLKQGLAFEKLNDKDTAKIVYYKLLDEYGKSDQAETARNRIKALK